MYKKQAIFATNGFVYYFTLIMVCHVSYYTQYKEKNMCIAYNFDTTYVTR